MKRKRTGKTATGDAPVAPVPSPDLPAGLLRAKDVRFFLPHTCSIHIQKNSAWEIINPEKTTFPRSIYCNWANLDHRDDEQRRQRLALVTGLKWAWEEHLVVYPGENCPFGDFEAMFLG